MKFCKDCANFSYMKYTDKDGQCSAIEHGVNLVTGEPNIRTCEAERSYMSSPIHCGIQGLFFVAKDAS